MKMMHSMSLRILAASAAIVLAASAAIVLAAGVPAWAADGAAIFRTQCAKCHGETGKADTPVSKALKVPALAGDARISGKSVDEIVAMMKANPKHPPTVKSMSDADLEAAAGHAKQLAAGK